MTAFERRAAFLVVSAAISVAAQHPAEIEALVERARSVPAEFSADALLRIAESGRVDDRGWKQELLEDAFRRAAGAQHRYKMRAIGISRGSRAGFLSRAYTQNLDAYSLQSRAVKAMLGIDKRKARELLGDMAPPQLPRLSCDDRLTYDLSQFYSVVAEVVQTAFTPAEAEKDEPLKLAERYLRFLNSGAQVTPVASALASIQLKPQALQAMVAGFSSALKELAADDRSFYTDSKTAGPAISRLAANCKKAGIATDQVIDAYRSYLARHLKAEHCPVLPEPAGLNFAFATAKEDATAGDALAYFNTVLRREGLPAGAEMPEISDTEITVPTKDASPVPGGCTSPECTDLAARYRDLIFAPNGLALSAEQRSTTEWQARLRDYLNTLSKWKDDPSAGPSEHFFLACSFYSDLVNIVPDGSSRDAVLRAFLTFLKASNYQQEDRMEWFLPVNTLVGRVMLDRAGMAGMMEELRKSGDPVIMLYVSMDQFAQRSPAETLSLL